MKRNETIVDDLFLEFLEGCNALPQRPSMSDFEDVFQRLTYCEECWKYFIATRTDIRYCSNTCGSRSRVRRFREKGREGYEAPNVDGEMEYFYDDAGDDKR